MAAKNRYTLEDIQDLISFKDSPFKEFVPYPSGGNEANPRTVWYFVWGRYDDALQMLISESFYLFPCKNQISRVLFSEVEELPLLTGYPKDCAAGKEIDGETFMEGNCTYCPVLAKWRLERGL